MGLRFLGENFQTTLVNSCWKPSHTLFKLTNKCRLGAGEGIYLLSCTPRLALQWFYLCSPWQNKAPRCQNEVLSWGVQHSAGAPHGCPVLPTVVHYRCISTVLGSSPSKISFVLPVPRIWCVHNSFLNVLLTAKSGVYDEQLNSKEGGT